MTAVILAAGRSRRMNTSVSKVLLPLAGQPVLTHIINAARAGGAERIIVVIGPGHEAIREQYCDQTLEFAVQQQPRGTADALLVCRDLLAKDEDCTVLCGDAPLVRGGTIQSLCRARRDQAATVAVLTAVLPDPYGYGRIVRGPGSIIHAIVEERDADEQTRRVKEINSGAYSFVWGEVRPALDAVEPSPVSGEYYLTDAIRAIRSAGRLVIAVVAEDADEVMGINTPEHFAMVEAVLLARSG